MTDRLTTLGRVLIIDMHSYPSIRLSYEVGAGQRPPVCLGVDDVHTQGWLADPAQAGAIRGVPAEVNMPFAGTYVPLALYGTEPRVESVMIEIRRDQYMDEPTLAPDTNRIEALARRIALLIDRWTDGPPHPVR